MRVLGFDDAVASMVVGGFVLLGTIVSVLGNRASVRRHVGKPNGYGPANRQLEDLRRRMDKMHDWAKSVDEYHRVADRQREETSRIVSQVAQTVTDHVKWEMETKYQRRGGLR